MKAELLLRDRLWLSDSLKVEVVIWKVPERVPGSAHCFKYRMALVADGACMMRYENEAWKGDHKHVGEDEVPYVFRDLKALQADFWAADVEAWRAKP